MEQRLDQAGELSSLIDLLECWKLHALALRKRNLLLHDTLCKYIHHNTHPSCLPAMRFRVIQPTGFSAYFSTYREAEDFLLGKHRHEEPESDTTPDQAIRATQPVEDQTGS